MISVVIPSYNHQAYIEECINSVINQTYRNWELIIIDDGSKDLSNEIIASFTDKRIHHIRQENSGAHNAINRGLSLCKGDYLTILNSDDTFHPKRFEHCLKQFENNQQVDFISTWLNIIDSDSQIKGIKKAWHNMEPWEIRNREATYLSTDDYALNALMANFVATTSNMIFRRKIFDALGGMRNLRFTHDWDFLLRVCRHYKCLNMEEASINYRIHNNNTISTNRKWMLFEVCWIIATHIDYFSHKLISGLTHEELISSSIKMLESFNFQGNDQVFWLLYWQIKQKRELGLINSEELYLNDLELRDTIISYIKG